DRPGADGRDDARDGRADGDARNPAPRGLEIASGHHADGQGDARRPGAMSGRRRQRLSGQAAGCRQAAVAGAGLDAAMTGASPSAATEKIELDLLLEAIHRRYHYDFRAYSRASLRRRAEAA